jgi:dTDP-4-amino-4,6-dideoxygalactose transaminase
VTLRIPTARLGAQRLGLGGALEQAVRDVIERGVLTPSSEVAAFETELAARVGVGHAVGTASGGWSIAVGLLAAGLEPGDEVLTVPNVDIAVTSPIALAGLSVRFVDIDPARHTMDAAALAAAVGPRTRAVLVVHLYGFPADLTGIAAVADAHDLVLVEDCSQALGAHHDGRPVGSVGRLGVMSCSSTKPLGALGKAGAIVTDDADVAARARELVNYGFDLACLDAINAGVPGTPFLYRSIGFNAALDELQAAVLRVKLRALPDWVARRRQHLARYLELLADEPRIRPIAAVPGTDPSPRVMVVRIPERDRVLRELHAEGIASTITYVPPLHVQDVYAHLRPPGGFPACEAAAEDLLCLPCYPELADGEVDGIVAALRRAVRSGSVGG